LEIAPGLRTTWVRAAVREIVVPGPSEETLAIDADDENVIDADELDPTDTSVTDRKSKDLN
jgi:preprotein translocase subunit YajC